MNAASDTPLANNADSARFRFSLGWMASRTQMGQSCVQDSPFCVAAASPCRALTRQPAAQIIMPSGLQAAR
jgi:hypothetical protein